MSSQFICAITTPVGNEAAGANEQSYRFLLYYLCDCASAIQTVEIEIGVKLQSWLGTD